MTETLESRSQLRDQIVADYHQECLLCHHAIHRGEVVKAGARNVLSEELIWLHPRCADFLLLMYGNGATLLDTGWRQAQYDQRCFTCHKMIVAGNLIYRVVRWKDPDDPLTVKLMWVCPNCHRHETAPGVS